MGGAEMVLDPVTTFVVYIVAMLVGFTLIAAIADLWLARDERNARRRARAAARAERMIGERASHVDGP